MSPVIRISEKTFERLKGYARPFEDTPEDIVRVALDALDAVRNSSLGVPKQSNRSPRQTKDTAADQREKKLPQKAFRAPLLQVLLALGGGGTVKIIRERIEPLVIPLLTEADYREVTSGDPRWWNAVCWERNDLLKEGYMRSDSERGTWELSERAKKELSRSATSGIPNQNVSHSATWRDDIETAMESIDSGEGVSLARIYESVAKIRKAGNRSVPHSLEATIRRTLEDNSSDSDNFRGEDIFYMAEGKGSGIWGLRRRRRSN